MIALVTAALCGALAVCGGGLALGLGIASLGKAWRRSRARRSDG